MTILPNNDVLVAERRGKIRLYKETTKELKDVAFLSVNDAESTEIDLSNIFVSVDYLEGMDKVAMSLGHQQVSAAVTGKALTQAMDCKVCHKELAASIGPNYTDIAKRYKEDKNAMSYLQKKIVKGGSGVWGEVMMAAHPNVTSNETHQIASYIMSLNENESAKPSLAPKGTITTEMVVPDNLMVLTASYTDNGAEGAAPLTGTTSVALSTNTILFSDKINAEGIQPANHGGKDLLLLLAANGWFEMADIDLTGFENIMLAAGWQEAPTVAYDFEVRANALDGEVIGKGRMNVPNIGSRGDAIVITLTKKVDEKTNLFIMYAVEEGKKPAQFALENVRLN